MQKYIILSFLFFLAGNGFSQKAKTPFKERNFRAATGQGRLFGTIADSRENKSGVLCILVAGSGPTDRNGNSGVFVYANSYKMLSDSLATRGHSVLRFDKRGVGESKYVFNSETELKFSLYVNDIHTIIQKVKADKDYKKVVVIGHSEGALIGLQAALKDSVAAYISLCGAGQSADSLILTQLSSIPKSLQEEAKEIIIKIKQGIIVEKMSEQLLSLFRPSVQPYLKSWFAVNPTEEISQIQIPTLIIQGGTDIQVASFQGGLLKAANEKADYVFISDMNHVLKRSSDNYAQNIRTYGDPYLALHPDLIPAIITFLNKVK